MFCCWFVSDGRITSSRSGGIALCPIRRTSQVCWSNVESEMRLRNSFPSSRKNLIPPSLLVEACVVRTVDENFAKKEEESIVEVERGEKERRKERRKRKKIGALKSCVLRENFFSPCFFKYHSKRIIIRYSSGVIK